MRRVVSAAAVLAALATPACGPVRMECDVCGETASFNTCHDLYCRYLAASSLCASTDLEACFARNECPDPYFLFCPADTRNE